MSYLDQRYQVIVERLKRDDAVNEVFIFEKADAIAREGHADAALLAARIHAIGYGCPRDWAKALEWLAVAAERGVVAAQEQLRFLADAEGDDWRALIARVDVDAWTAARQGHAVNAQPSIRMVFFIVVLPSRSTVAPLRPRRRVVP